MEIVFSKNFFKNVAHAEDLNLYFLMNILEKFEKKIAVYRRYDVVKELRWGIKNILQKNQFLLRKSPFLNKLKEKSKIEKTVKGINPVSTYAYEMALANESNQAFRDRIKRNQEYFEKEKSRIQKIIKNYYYDDGEVYYCHIG